MHTTIANSLIVTAAVGATALLAWTAVDALTPPPTVYACHADSYGTVCEPVQHMGTGTEVTTTGAGLPVQTDVTYSYVDLSY